LALNCQRSGGIAAIITVDLTTNFITSLLPDTEVTIPVVLIDDSKAKVITDSYTGMSAVIGSSDGYMSLDGTSMAAPYVTGAIASLWRSCPKCSNADVLLCLQNTAMDLGDPGKDAMYGYGLVQATNARECLQQSSCCAS
jgi:serine protease